MAAPYPTGPASSYTTAWDTIDLRRLEPSGSLQWATFIRPELSASAETERRPAAGGTPAECGRAPLLVPIFMIYYARFVGSG
jgi:hypothetical protein